MPDSLLPSLLLALAPLAVPSVPPPGRTVVPLDAGWSFEGPSVDGRTVEATVAVPHTWNATDTLDGLQYARGVGTYALALPIEASAAGYLPNPAFSALLTLGAVTLDQDFVLTAAP